MAHGESNVQVQFGASIHEEPVLQHHEVRCLITAFSDHTDGTTLTDRQIK
jgi:hypothetical protein